MKNVTVPLLQVFTPENAYSTWLVTLLRFLRIYITPLGGYIHFMGVCMYPYCVGMSYGKNRNNVTMLIPKGFSWVKNCNRGTVTKP